jgi:hypothetical protein
MNQAELPIEPPDHQWAIQLVAGDGRNPRFLSARWTWGAMSKAREFPNRAEAVEAASVCPTGTRGRPVLLPKRDVDP